MAHGVEAGETIEEPTSLSHVDSDVDSLMISISHVPGFVFDLEKPSLKPEEMQDTVLFFLRQPLECGPPRSPTHSLTRRFLGKLSGRNLLN